MRTKYKILTSIILFISIFASATIFNSCNKRNGPELDQVKLRLQWVHQAQFVGFYVAKEKGFYQEKNIDLTINSGGVGYNAPLMVTQRQDDFGIWVANNVLIARDKEGMPIKAIGTVYNRSLACFMVREDSGINTPKDFEGKTVGIYAGFDTESIYIELLRKFQVDRSKIKEFPAAYNLAPFFDNQVQVWPSYVINEPLSAAEQNIKTKCLGPDQFGIKYYSDTLIVHEDTLRDKRDLVERFLEASEKGWRYALKHPDEAVDIVLKYQQPPHNKEHEMRMFNALASYVNTTDPMFQMSPEVWKSMAETLKGQSAINEIESYEKLCDFNIATEAHKKLDK
jgi:NitT/TauT family transport system substrate-binding protein